MDKPKSKRGGPRANSGPKPRKSTSKVYQTGDPDDFLRALMRDATMPMAMRVKAAHALAKGGPYERPPGKRARAQAEAEAIVGRSLKPVPPPGKGRRHLRVVK